MKKPRIGILALQGAIEPHRPHIEAAGGSFHAVKTPDSFENIDAFILPGGESTTMLNLIERFNLWEPLAHHFARKPVWGICAGAILMAQTVTNPAQKSFGLLPMTVQRNGYGRQLESHHGEINAYPVSFIRAPLFERYEHTEIMATHNGTPVWVQKNMYMATAFHPELTQDFPSPMHRHFIDLVRKSAT